MLARARRRLADTGHLCRDGGSGLGVGRGVPILDRPDLDGQAGFEIAGPALGLHPGSTGAQCGDTGQEDQDCGNQEERSVTARIGR